MVSLSDEKQASVAGAFNTESRCLDDILNINSVNFDNIVGQIYLSRGSNLIKPIPLILRRRF